MLDTVFDTTGLAPHGTCLLWREDLFWSLATADSVIALSYFSISIAIIVYTIRRTDMYLRWVAQAFALFILLCGSSHFTDLWTLWSPQYGIQTVIKAAAALVSLVTAAALWPLLPHALSLPSTAQLTAANQALERENDERRRAEASLRATEAELRAANGELEGFAYAVSHDLRAPLRAMTGFSEALLEDFGDRLDEDGHRYLKEIAHAGRHMGDLIDGLLQLSRVTRGQLDRTWVDVTALAGRIRDEIETDAPARPATWRIDAGLTLWGDPRLIEVALRNLLDNARKFTAHVAEPTIRIEGDPDGAIRVSDNGAGFDMAHAGKLFVPFQRLHRQDEFQGIGIGLSTVIRIARRHGGTIEAEGAVGRGATFRLSLPGPALDAGEVEHEDRGDPAGGGQPPGRNVDVAGAG